MLNRCPPINLVDLSVSSGPRFRQAAFSQAACAWWRFFQEEFIWSQWARGIPPHKRRALRGASQVWTAKRGDTCAAGTGHSRQCIRESDSAVQTSACQCARRRRASWGAGRPRAQGEAGAMMVSRRATNAPAVQRRSGGFILLDCTVVVTTRVPTMQCIVYSSTYRRF